MTATRRLAAILVADVVGYSRMMEADEAGTLAALKDRRTAILEPVIKQHAGRVVKFMGDGVLVEFFSAVNAVKGALELQARFAASNETLPDDRRILLRIGINLGDVVGEGSDIFGDGVNIAARLESLAQPGGICVSAKVRDEVQGKLPATFVPMGLQTLKNISAQIDAFRVTEGTGAAKPIPAASDRLSIAVLPFTHMGGDAEDQHFADGMTEDIITELSRISFLHVAARNTAFRFRGADADIATAARALGVRFVIDGSVRRMGPRLRISAQLIDTTTGAHLWAERYDRPLEGIHDVQDEVVRTIATTAASRLQIAGADMARRKPEDQRSAQELILQAETADWYNHDSRKAAVGLALQALDIAPTAARAHAILAFLFHTNWLEDFDADDSALDAAIGHARRAVALGPGDYYSHLAMANVCLYRGDFELAQEHLSRAQALNPDRPGVLATTAHLAIFQGRPVEAQKFLEAAGRLDTTFAPSWYWSNMMLIRYVGRDDAGAVGAFHRQTNPRPWTLAYAAAAYANLGDTDATRTQVAAILALYPQFTITVAMTREPFRHDSDRIYVRDGMLRAGLPL